MTVSTLLLQASAHAIPLKDASVQTLVEQSKRRINNIQLEAAL